MIYVLFVDEQVILAATALMPSVVMNLATLHRTGPTRFLHQGHCTTKTDLVQGINIPTPKGTDCIPPIMVPDMGDIAAGHSPTTTTKAAVSEGQLVLLFQPLQQLMLPFGQWMLPSPLVP